MRGTPALLLVFLESVDLAKNRGRAALAWRQGDSKLHPSPACQLCPELPVQETCKGEREAADPGDRLYEVSS